MSNRLATDLMLIDSYTRQIEALCAVAIESLDNAQEGERGELLRVAEQARALGERVNALRRRHPSPRHVPLPTPFA